MMTAEDVWEWLATCVTCGKVHQQRTVNGAPNYASETDGHPMRLRMQAYQLSALHQAWKEHIASE